MKKKILYLFGFIGVFVVSFLLKGTLDNKLIEQTNQIHLLGIIRSSLSVFGLFLLLKFFSSATWKFITFAIVYAIIMILELSLGYFYGNGHFDYNYLIGCLLGLVCVYILDYVVAKTQSDNQEEQSV
jgi:hypothetical protein